MLINILIFMIFLLIFYQLFFKDWKKKEGYMSVIPKFNIIETVKKDPKFTPINNYYPNSIIRQDFDPNSVITTFS
jgi:hypothetical protein